MAISFLSLVRGDSVALSLAALALSGCFDPTIRSCLLCTRQCPDGQMCVRGVCIRPGESPDACNEVVIAPEQPSPFIEDDGPEDSEPPEGRRDDCASSAAIQASFASSDALLACTGRRLDVELRVDGGEPPYRWFLPKALEGPVLAQDGSGIARLRGSFADTGSHEIQVSVESGGDECLVTTLTVPFDVRATPTIVTEPPVPCSGQNDYRALLEGQGGDPDSYEWDVRDLPNGLRFEDGAIVSVDSVLLREEVELTLSLSDAYCGPSIRKVRWPANSGNECFSIQPPELPAPCSGIAYSERLTSTVSDPDEIWQLASEPPPGLTFDPATATVSGFPEGPGELHVQLLGSDGRVAERRYPFELRESCRFAYIAESDARLHLTDVFLTEGLETILPAVLGADEAVSDFAFSPDGAWLAMRAGLPEAQRLYVHNLRPTGRALTPATNAASSSVPFTCPLETDLCDVLDYVWSADSRRLAVVLRGDPGGAQDYLSGLDVAASDVHWPLLGSDGVFSLPLSYQGELTWIDERRVALVTVDPFAATQQAAAWAELGALTPGFDTLQIAPAITGGQLGLLPAPGGVVVFNGIPGSTMYLDPTADFDRTLSIAADQRGPWLAPGQTLAARTTAQGSLEIFTLTGEVQAVTPDGVCGTVLAWSAVDERHRIVCSALDSTGQAIAEDMRLIDYTTSNQQLVASFIPELERNVLESTRRLFSPSTSTFTFRSTNGLGLVDTSQPQPLTSELFTSVENPFNLQYGSDNRVLLHTGTSLTLITTSPVRFRPLAGDPDAEAEVTLPLEASCQEEFSLAPHNWCGAPSIPSPFAWSADSRTILFEDDAGGLWLSDAQIFGPPRRVTTSLAPCSGLVRTGWTEPCSPSYAFQP